MGQSCCRPPQLRFGGLHFPFLSYTQSYATTWLHSGLLYFRPALAGLLWYVRHAPESGGRFLARMANERMHGDNVSPRFMPPLRSSHLFFCGGSRGLGLRVCAFYALTGRPLRGSRLRVSRLRCCAATPWQATTGLLYGAPGAQMTIKGVMRGSRRNMKGAMVMEPTRQRGASVIIMTALPA